MPDRTQDLKNHRQVAVACKNYTDSEIKKSEEKILSIVARNNVDFIDHINEPTYRFTAPLNSKLLMLQSIAGNSVKYSPSVASDNTVAHIKTLPSTVYDLDVSKVDGVGYKVNQLVGNLKATFTTGGVTFTNNGDGSMTLNGTATEEIGTVSVGVDVTANITFPRRSHKVLVTCNNTLSGFYIGVSGYSINNSGAFFFNESNPTDWTNGIGCHIVAGTVFNNFKIIPQVLDLTTDFGSGNEPSTVSDCATEYVKRGINIYSYTPQQSSIKNNAFTGATVEGVNMFDYTESTDDKFWSYANNTSVMGDLVGTCASGFIKVLPNTNYTITTYISVAGVALVKYWKSTLDVSAWSGIRAGDVITCDGTKQTYTFTTKSDCNYITINCDVANKENVIVNKGSIALPYEPYVSQTLSIDLTTIKDSNNVSLFPSGKMMGNSSVADFITPYNQESRWNEVDLSTCVWEQVGATSSGYYVWRTTSITDIKYVANNTQVGNGVYSKGKIRMASGMTGNTDLYDLAIDTAQVSCVTTNGTTDKPTGILQYERATYLTSNTDLTSLTGIQGQSLGTVTLNNTGNVDMPNLILYNGVIKHALATAVKYESFNVWDEEWAVGTYYPNTINSKNPISLISGLTYYLKAPSDMLIFFYDSNMATIGDEQRWYANATKVIPNNAKYMTFRMTSNYGTTYQNDICINISGTLNGTYKAHKPTYTRALTNNEAKYSWGITTGVRNVRTYCDDEGNAVNEGSLVVGNQDLGGLIYTYFANQGNNSLFETQFSSLKRNTPNLLNELYTVMFPTSLNTDDLIMGIEGSQFRIRNTVFNNATIFKTAMTGKPLFYEKETTTLETLDDFDYFFDCEEGDTFTLVNSENLQCYATYSFLIKEAKSNE